MTDQLTLAVRPFDELDLRELHDLLRLRVDVFVVEQAAAWPELDGVDPDCTHLLAIRSSVVVGTCRWRVGEEATELGRIVVRASDRGRGVGRALVGEALRHVPADRPVRIAAQARLERFYRSFGFRSTGDPYPEYGVLHIDMSRPAGSPPPTDEPD